MSFTLGMVNRKDIKAEFDAKILKGLKDSGAILLGVTNIPEYNLWVESRNNVYGQTSNPYDINRGVGGSSGGEVNTSYVNLFSLFFKLVITTCKFIFISNSRVLYFDQLLQKGTFYIK